jgi:mono/diheme cytochrome c family protein
MKIQSKNSRGRINSSVNQVLSCLIAIGLIFLMSSCNSSNNESVPNPIADAGINRIVDEQTTVTLVGSGVAIVGSIDSINWQQLSGETVVLSSPDSGTTNFLAPTLTSNQILTFQITVTDNQGKSGTDTVDITVVPVNNLPTANAGADQSATGGDIITLSGSATDADGSIASYTWTQISGTQVILDDPSLASTTFASPISEDLTDLVFELGVVDNEGGQSTDSVTITLASDFELADGINGGRLYSKFWATETGFDLGNSNLQDQTELDAITTRSDFFRCKQCHGWDRLGREGGYSNRAPKTSRPNVADFNLAEFSQTATVEGLFNAVKTGTVARRDISTDLTGYDPAGDTSVGDQMPNYSQILTDPQIWDLANYLKAESIDTSLLYDITLDDGVYPTRGRSFSNLGLDGDAMTGDIIFAASCAGCHGDDGTAFRVDGGDFTVGGHLRAKPYEDQHKVKFGHLGSSMGAILATAPFADIKDLYKALSDPDKYPDNDGINGGRLYSKFWATETGFTLENSNLQSQAELDAITTRSDFFRCKQCHGWDRLGREGGYSNRAPKTSRPNVADFDLAAFSATATDQEMFDAIKTGAAPRRDIATDLTGYDPAVDPIVGDQMPNYSQILTDGQIWELVTFLKVKALDTSLLYDITLDNGVYPDRGRSFSNIGLDGDAINGDNVYTDNCAGCHGADGTTILVDGGAFTLGAHFRSKPYEDQHKVKFGHLGSSMGAILANAPFSDIKDLMKAFTDTEKYPDVQVLNGINGGRLYSKFWATETGFTLGNSSLQSQAELDAITTRSDFFRCKQCHGWDRLGREGGYSNRAPKISRPNIADFDLAAFSASATEQEIFDAIKTGTTARRDISTDLTGYDPAVDPTLGDQMPNYSQVLTDPQIWQLANYLKVEALDTTLLYDITLDGGVYPDRGRTFSNLGLAGDAINGATVYSTDCESCHGADGTAFLVDGDTFTLGAHFRAKPYEDQHKVKFGHLGSSMGAIMSLSPFSDIVDLYKAMSDPVAFPDDQIPVEDGAALFTSRCGSCHTGNGLGSGTTSDVTGALASTIITAINGGVPTMASLSDLTVAEIDAIAAALQP